MSIVIYMVIELLSSPYLKPSKLLLQWGRGIMIFVKNMNALQLKIGLSDVSVKKKRTVKSSKNGAQRKIYKK